MKKFYSGFVSLIGRPNVGKSTLMNCLIGEKIAITSNKPQTTRNKITSILTKDDFQCVFLDTPGIHKPKHKLGEFMVRSAENTFKEVDLVLFLVEPTDKVLEADQYVLEKLGNVKTPVVPFVLFLNSNKRTEYSYITQIKADGQLFQILLTVAFYVISIKINLQIPK